MRIPVQLERVVVRLFELFGVLSLCAGHAKAELPEYHEVYHQAAFMTAAHLVQSQNPDGSWGYTEDVRPLYTASAVEALRSYTNGSYYRGSYSPAYDPNIRELPERAYYRGVTWLENHAMGNVDDHSRRAVVLAEHGDDVSADIAFLADHFSSVLQAVGGWGLASAYAPSARETALALLAIDAVAMAGDFATEVQAALDFLVSSQRVDGGWPAGDRATSDPIVSSIVLRTLSIYLATNPTLLSAGNSARAYLQAAATAGDPTLVLGHAALAIQRWTPGTTSVDALLDELQSTQSDTGSYIHSDTYLASMALRAFAARLGTDDPTLREVIVVPDFALREAINLSLGHNRVDVLRRADLQALVSLNFSGLGITELTGLEEATYLAFLDLRNNHVSDVSPLSNLTTLGNNVMLHGNPFAGTLCDLNDNGVIGVGDAVLALRLLNGESPPSLLEKTKFDVAPASGPGDGKIGVEDLVTLLRAVRGDYVAACGS